MSTSTPSKATPPAPPQSATAFGVTIASAQQSVEKPPMSRNQKALYSFLGIIVALGVSLYIQYRPRAEEDPDAAGHPAVAEVAKAAENKDTSGLIQFTKNDDVVVAQRAVRALGALGGADALQDSLRDERPEVRAEAISQISDRADVSQLPVLSQHLQDPAPEVRIAAMRGVASIRNFSMFDHLVPMLSDPDVNVRRSAISALEEKMGQKFSKFDPNNMSTAQATIARINAILPGFKKKFDSVNEIEANKKK